MQMKEPDYQEFWRNLVLSHKGEYPEGPSIFNRKDKAEAFEEGTRRKNRAKRDVLIDFVKADLKPGETAMDVGAGTGRWTVPLAQVAARVTAVEPAGAMMDILKRNVAETGKTNVDFVQSRWEDAEVGMHDIVTSAHSIYMSLDFAAFVHKMEAHARRRVYIAMRHFPIDGIIQELSIKIYGNRHDGPNFIIGYNALYQMGIYANVLMEDVQHRWTDATVEDAFARAKRHLHLEGNAAYDDLLRETLKRRLTFKDGVYSWPDGMNSALVWWEVTK
jgi:FkbM family methyltransferase